MRLFLLLLLLLASPGAVAQGSASAAAPPTMLPQPKLATDTAAALHRLFARRRHNGHTGLVVGGALVAVGGATMALAVNNGSSQALAPYFGGVLGALIGLPILTRGIVLTITHSQGRERRVLQAWQQHRLPERWAHRALIPTYTQP